MKIAAKEENRKVSYQNLGALPNLVTYARIILVPIMVVAYFLSSPLGNWLALFFFITAALTDALDGHLARILKQGSRFGRMLDPIADKILVSAALLMLAGSGVIEGVSLFAALIILSREILVSGLREHLAHVHVSTPVTHLSKWKTLIQMIALGFLICGAAGERIFPYTIEVGLGLLWIAAVLTLYTGYDYLRAGLTHFSDDDAQ